MVHRFAVGDRVRVVEITHGAPRSTIGMIGTLREYDGDWSDCIVDFPQIGDYWFYVNSELEFVASADQAEVEAVRIARSVLADDNHRTSYREYVLATALIRITDRSI